MLELEQLDPNATVFPQDVPVADGSKTRYGGLTKREHFILSIACAGIASDGMPTNDRKANDLIKYAILLGDGLATALVANPPKAQEVESKEGEPPLIIVPGGGRAS